MTNENYKELPELIPKEFIERTLKLSSSLLCDGMIDLGLIKDGAMDYSIKPVDDSLKMAGTAATVSTEEGDNYAVNAGIYKGKPGYILVVDGKANKERAHIGDLMARSAKAIGFNGMVIDGLVRDKIDIKKIGLPVFCRGFIQRKPTQTRSGELNTIISCGGIQVTPGDLVFGDWDGITVVPRRHIEKVLEKLNDWMDKHGYNSLDDFKGKLSGKNVTDNRIYKRAQYVDLLMKADNVFKKYPMP